MEPNAAANGVAVWQVAAILVALALVVAGAGYFWHRWRAHDEAGRPRPPDESPPP
jgi:hypothetical protein